MRAPRTLSAYVLALTASLWSLPLRAAEAEGLPQLNPEHFVEQLFWLAITFTVLYLLMSKIAMPSVQATQDKRAATIGGELTAAQTANDQAKTMMAQYEKALADARAQAQATVSRISAEASKEAAVKQAAQQEQLSKRLAEAEAKIAAVRDAAIKDIKASATDLAGAIVEKVSGSKMQPIRAAGGQ